ncbi:ImcF-related family protein [uncultured Ruegeria sp.]|uniref:ImcF-related family protein n=1 Tax=uncultured Ruegeria sp. TaxID=259304 RepID=UPI00261695E4|nr:ImcF-related family protein [uncultured Ruegeria sp.]
MGCRDAQTEAAKRVFEKAAAPVFDLIDHMDEEVRAGETTLLARVESALTAFTSTLERSNVPQPAIAPARLTLAALVDARARAQSRLKLASWGVLAQNRLFDGRDMPLSRIREFAATAREAGPEYAGLAEFLEDVAKQIQTGGRNLTRSQSSWGLFAALSVTVFLLALTGYACWLEYRFHTRISESFQQDIQGLTITPDVPRAELAQLLTQLSRAHDRVARAAQYAPFRRVVRLPGLDSETNAEAIYRDAVATTGPSTLAVALEGVLATEGDSLKLYDALRAFAVLSGDLDWSSAYLEGWLEDNQNGLELPGFSRHVAAFPQPDGTIHPSDTQVFDQARVFASETSEVDRVWLELLRAPQTRSLPPWNPEVSVPGLSDILVRRSGAAMDTTLPGLFTQEGWAYARDYGIGVAVQEARRLTPAVLDRAPQPVNQTPDDVQVRLHKETIAIWTDWLADLRVEPFDDPDRAIQVSGTLAQRMNPLSQVLRTSWAQMGGQDRSRSFDQQVELGRIFGPVIQWMDEGGMAELNQLFSTLNVALSTRQRDTEKGTEKLVSVQERARTINVLQTAPRIIIQIAEDVLAQANAAASQSGADPLILRWQQAIYPTCRAALDGQFPFADGSDATPSEVIALLAPGGSLMQFYNAYLAQFVDQSARPWRWKPEARFAGLDPDSAAFFERAVFLSEALFDAQGQLRLQIEMATLAERGTTVVALGGQGVPVRATGEPATLTWPGPAPLMGASISFREGVGSADLTAAGYWGLLRLLDQFRLRFRDEGARVLVDMRSSEGRAFVEMVFPDAANPVAARRLMAGFSCPPRL